MDYDVFISCKSEDYELAEEVYQYLKENDIKAFLSSKELMRMKETDYCGAISKALDTSYHLVVLASSKEYLTGGWVYFEWNTFLNEKLSGRKQGQIMTVLSGVEVKDLPIQLRQYESLDMNNYREKLLAYVETPGYIARRGICKKTLGGVELSDEVVERGVKTISKIAEMAKNQTVVELNCEENQNKVSINIDDLKRQTILKGVERVSDSLDFIRKHLEKK